MLFNVGLAQRHNDINNLFYLLAKLDLLSVEECYVFYLDVVEYMDRIG